MPELPEINPDSWLDSLARAANVLPEWVYVLLVVGLFLRFAGAPILRAWRCR